jgi:C1A family cysteine protease
MGSFISTLYSDPNVYPITRRSIGGHNTSTISSDPNQTEEFVSKGFGWIPDIPDPRDRYLDINRLSNLKSYLLSETSADLRTTNFMPDIYDQGQLGSCTSQAIVGAFMFDHLKQSGPAFKGSRLFVYYNERVVEDSVDTDSGASIRDGIKVTNTIGVAPEEDYPYVISHFTEKPSEKSFVDAQKHKNVLYERVNISVQDFKQVISKGFPVVFGFSVPKSFQSLNMKNTGIMSRRKLFEPIIGGHAVLACGFNDNMTANGETGYMLIRNSWGTDWGQSGYFWMPYSFITEQNCDDAWIIELIKEDSKDLMKQVNHELISNFQESVNLRQQSQSHVSQEPQGPQGPQIKIFNPNVEKVRSLQIKQDLQQDLQDIQEPRQDLQQEPRQEPPQEPPHEPWQESQQESQHESQQDLQHGPQQTQEDLETSSVQENYVFRSDPEDDL